MYPLRRFFAEIQERGNVILTQFKVIGDWFQWRQLVRGPASSHHPDWADIEGRHSITPGADLAVVLTRVAEFAPRILNAVDDLADILIPELMTLRTRRQPPLAIHLARLKSARRALGPPRLVARGHELWRWLDEHPDQTKRGQRDLLECDAEDDVRAWVLAVELSLTAVLAIAELLEHDP
jgi:hypothetical protein